MNNDRELRRQSRYGGKVMSAVVNLSLKRLQDIPCQCRRRGLDPWVGKIHSQESGLLKHINIVTFLYMYFIELYNSYYNCDKIVDQALFSTCNILLADFQ